MMKRMTVSGRRRVRGKWRPRQKQHGRITQLFFIHTPLHSHSTQRLQKVARAPRKPSSKQHTRQFLKSVTPIPLTKAFLRLMRSSLLLLSLYYCKHVRRGSSILLPTMYHFPPGPHREASCVKNCPCLGPYTGRHGN